MKPFEATNKLRELLDQIDKISTEVHLPDDDYGLAEALAKLRLAFPDAYLSIGFRIGCSTTDKTVVEWKVWDGDHHHDAATLKDAVNLALGRSAPPPADAVADTEAVLETAVVMPF